MSALRDFSVLEIGDSTGTEYAGKLLADLGARVVKMEPPGGARSRQLPPFYRDEEGPDNSIHFWYYNTSKDSVILDTDTGEGKDSLRRLIDRVDAVIDGGAVSLRETIDRMELDFDPLAGKVVCRVTEFGSEGPWTDYLASDLAHLALGGIMASCGYDEPDATPIGPSGGQSHHITGVNIAMAVLAGLLGKQAGESTPGMDISAHDCVTMATEMSFAYGEYQDVTPNRQAGRHARPYATSPWNHRCLDGKYINCLPLYLTDDRFAAMLEWFDSHGLAGDLADPRYATRDQRTQLLDDVIAVIGRFCAHFDSDYIFHEAQSRRLPWAPVNWTWDLVEDPHFVARGAFARVTHEGVGSDFSYPGAPYLFSRTPWRISHPAPALPAGPSGSLGKERIHG